MTGRTLIDTPPSLVMKGRVAEFGWFAGPMTCTNIVDTGPAGVPAWARRFRLKQWQHVAVVSDELLLAFAIVDAGYLGSSFCHAYDRADRRHVEHHRETPPGGVRVAAELWDDGCAIARRGYAIDLGNMLGERRHTVDIDIAGDRQGPGIVAELELHDDPASTRPLVVALPINEPGRVLFTHKSPCPVSGVVRVGDRRYTLDKTHTWALLDVQKTYYPYRTRWYWATFAGRVADGRAVAINLVKNMIADDERWNENALWLDGALHPLGAASFEVDSRDPKAPWRILATDGGCDLLFRPEGERAGNIEMGVISSRYRQPFGVFEGTARAGGETVAIDRVFGVVEDHSARF